MCGLLIPIILRYVKWALNKVSKLLKWVQHYYACRISSFIKFVSYWTYVGWDPFPCSIHTCSTCRQAQQWCKDACCSNSIGKMMIEVSATSNEFNNASMLLQRCFFAPLFLYKFGLLRFLLLDFMFLTNSLKTLCINMTIKIKNVVS